MLWQELGSAVCTSEGLQGWKQFVRDNKLQMGDLCLFELLENMKRTMKVYVIRSK